MELKCQTCLGLIEKGIQRLREIGMLEWICDLRLAYSPWEDSEDMPFITIVRSKFVRGTPAS